jgi:hypothetical protein
MIFIEHFIYQNSITNNIISYLFQTKSRLIQATCDRLLAKCFRYWQICPAHNHALLIGKGGVRMGF